MLMNIKSTGYGEDTGWKVRYRLSTLNFVPHERSLNTKIVQKCSGEMWSKYRVDSSFNKSEGSYIYEYRVRCL
jgi:hypothetical protein